MNRRQFLARLLLVGIFLVIIILAVPGCDSSEASGKADGAEGTVDEERVVVVYTALDRQYSEPIFQRFEQETGIRVLPKYDTESTKTVGLVNAIRAESQRPRCDVFWNNEVLNTIRLAQEGLLQPYRSANAKSIPKAFRDERGFWTGFAARARILLVNTDLVAENEIPRSIFDLAEPKWRGKVGIAKPLFGSTATHAACLFARLGDKKAKSYFKMLLDNNISIEASNSRCAQKVAAGQLAVCLTDTDDALVQIAAGKPVRIVYPDVAHDELGVLFFPNTVAMLKGAPHSEEARVLIDYLLRPEVEAALANCPSGQIPLNRQVTVKPPVQMPNDVSMMRVDFQAAADHFEDAMRFIRDHFQR